MAGVNQNQPTFLRHVCTSLFGRLLVLFCIVKKNTSKLPTFEPRKSTAKSSCFLSILWNLKPER